MRRAQVNSAAGVMSPATTPAALAPDRDDSCRSTAWMVELLFPTADLTLELVNDALSHVSEPPLLDLGWDKATLHVVYDWAIRKLLAFYEHDEHARLATPSPLGQLVECAVRTQARMEDTTELYAEVTRLKDQVEKLKRELVTCQVISQHRLERAARAEAKLDDRGTVQADEEVTKLKAEVESLQVALAATQAKRDELLAERATVGSLLNEIRGVLGTPDANDIVEAVKRLHASFTHESAIRSARQRRIDQPYGDNHDMVAAMRNLATAFLANEDEALTSVSLLVNPEVHHNGGPDRVRITLERELAPEGS